MFKKKRKTHWFPKSCTEKGIHSGRGAKSQEKGTKHTWSSHRDEEHTREKCEARDWKGENSAEPSRVEPVALMSGRGQWRRDQQLPHQVAGTGVNPDEGVLYVTFTWLHSVEGGRGNRVLLLCHIVFRGWLFTFLPSASIYIIYKRGVISKGNVVTVGRGRACHGTILPNI